jgi:hypothetical protein
LDFKKPASPTSEEFFAWEGEYRGWLGGIGVYLDFTISGKK